MHDNDNKFLLRFARAATIRAVRTFAQTAAATLVASGAGMLSGVDWRAVLSVAALAAVTSVLTSIGTDLPEIELPTFPDSGNESP